MIVEQMLKNAPNPLLHIADVIGSKIYGLWNTKIN